MRLTTSRCATASSVLADAGRVDVMVNNAGIAVAGVAERPIRRCTSST
jgi:NAD(P)-dependent dehydrogenase (short-subunit alcohol dehydrogenase family)